MSHLTRLSVLSYPSKWRGVCVCVCIKYTCTCTDCNREHVHSCVIVFAFPCVHFVPFVYSPESLHWLYTLEISFTNAKATLWVHSKNKEGLISLDTMYPTHGKYQTITLDITLDKLYNTYIKPQFGVLSGNTLLCAISVTCLCVVVYSRQRAVYRALPELCSNSSSIPSWVLLSCQWNHFTRMGEHVENKNSLIKLNHFRECSHVCHWNVVRRISGSK